MQTKRDEKSASLKVLEAVADAKGVDVSDLRPPLGEVIDPDALNKLCARDTNSTAIRVTFRYGGYEVNLETNSNVTVRNPGNGIVVGTNEAKSTHSSE